MTKRIAELEAKLAAAMDALEAVEFDCRGKCVACGGWNVDPNIGETPHKHTVNCPVAAALRTSGERKEGE